MKTMKTLATVVVLACAAGAPVAAGQDHDDHMMSDEQAMYAMMMPGAEHERLHYLVGDWHAEMKYRMAQGMTPVEGEFDSHMELIMGGRFIEEHVTSEMDDELFEGRGILGFDKTKNRYVSIWFDNAGTSIASSEGYWDEDSKTMEFHGYGPDMSGEWKNTRSILERHGKNTMSMREWVYEDDGSRWLRFEATYARK